MDMQHDEKCECGDMKMGGMGWHHRHRGMRVLGMIIVTLFIFWCGFQFGEMRSEFRSYGNYGGYGMMGNYGNYGGYNNGYGMMRGWGVQRPVVNQDQSGPTTVSPGVTAQITK